MKGREGKGPPSTDLLVCFPSRAHLTLMPKPICSPARPSEPNKRHHNHQNSHHNHHLMKKSSNRNGVGGQGSPNLWAKNKTIMSKENINDEPTSPKVTCAGQIKVKPNKASSCKNWQSVMEEIERLHNKSSKHNKKRPAWIEAIGFKKDVMQFLTCLRNIRFDFRCFGAFPSTSITSDDEEADADEEDDDDFHQDRHPNKDAGDDDHDHDGESSRTVFSKWFMVLQENNNSTNKTDSKLIIKEEDQASDEAPCAPPPNALLLMRCRSAPAKSWLEELQQQQEEEVEEEEKEEKEESHDNEKQRKEEEDGKRAEVLDMEEKKRKENLVVMRCGTADFYKFSSDIAKETWVVGGIKESLSRSRSWKR